MFPVQVLSCTGGWCEAIHRSNWLLLSVARILIRRSRRSWSITPFTFAFPFIMTPYIGSLVVVAFIRTTLSYRMLPAPPDAQWGWMLSVYGSVTQRAVIWRISIFHATLCVEVHKWMNFLSFQQLTRHFHLHIMFHANSPLALKKEIEALLGQNWFYAATLQLLWLLLELSDTAESLSELLPWNWLMMWSSSRPDLPLRRTLPSMLMMMGRRRCAARLQCSR